MSLGQESCRTNQKAKSSCHVMLNANVSGFLGFSRRLSLWWAKRHWDQFDPSVSVWPCQCHSTNSPYQHFILLPTKQHRLGQLSRYSDSLRARRSGERISVWTRFSAPVQTGLKAHPASYTMGTGSFQGVKRPERGVDHPPNLAPRLRKE